jgi:hypothetical protein
MIAALFLLAPLLSAMLAEGSSSEGEEEKDSSETYRRDTTGYDPLYNKTWILEQKWKITE